MIGYDSGAANAGGGLINLLVVIDAGAAYDLGDNDALCAVDDKGAAVCHKREIAHEDFLFLDFLGLAVAQTNANLEGCCVCGIARLALLLGVFGLFVHGIIHEAKLKVTRIVGN